MPLYAASLFIFFFTAANLFFHVRCSLALKAVGTLLLFGASLKYEIYRFFGGNFFAPDLPRQLILLLESLYGSLLLLFFLLLLLDLYLLGNWLLARAGIPVPRHLPTGWIKIGLIAAALGLGCFGTWQAVKVPDVKTIELKLADLPAPLDGFSIVQLTDLHMGTVFKKDWLEQVVAKTNELKPDVVAMTGDYVDGYVDKIGQELEPLAGLQARFGVFAVTGNHEYYWNMSQWQEALTNLNVRLLENEHHVLNVNGKRLIIAGIPDLAAERFSSEQPDLAAALKNAPAGLRILLAHQPKHARGYASHADLILSGHTHGGLMFFLQPLIARFNAGFVAGLYPLEGGQLYVSPGTGLWGGFASRIGVPAQITRIVLKADVPHS